MSRWRHLEHKYSKMLLTYVIKQIPETFLITFVNYSWNNFSWFSAVNAKKLKYLHILLWAVFN